MLHIYHTYMIPLQSSSLNNHQLQMFGLLHATLQEQIDHTSFSFLETMWAWVKANVIHTA